MRRKRRRKLEVATWEEKLKLWAKEEIEIPPDLLFLAVPSFVC